MTAWYALLSFASVTASVVLAYARINHHTEIRDVAHLYVAALFVGSAAAFLDALRVRGSGQSYTSRATDRLVFVPYSWYDGAVGWLLGLQAVALTVVEVACFLTQPR